MNSTTNLSELEKLSDDKELRPTERVRLASLILRITGHDYGEPGSFLSAHLHRLDRQTKAADAAARSRHWQTNGGQALAAARYYIQAQSSGTPISLDTVAKHFNTSARSIGRYAQRLKKASGVSK
jgi:hypothetical protein